MDKVNLYDGEFSLPCYHPSLFVYITVVLTYSFSFTLSFSSSTISYVDPPPTLLDADLRP